MNVLHTDWKMLDDETGLTIHEFPHGTNSHALVNFEDDADEDQCLTVWHDGKITTSGYWGHFTLSCVLKRALIWLDTGMVPEGTKIIRPKPAAPKPAPAAAPPTPSPPATSPARRKRST